MMKPLRRFAPLAFALLATLPAALADTIYTIDGKTIEDVEIVNETLTHVYYRQKGKTEQSVAADTVLRVEYSKLPKRLDEAETMISDGQLQGGVEALQLYVDGILDGQQKEKMAWAPAYALRRIVELKQSLGDWAGVVTSADQLIKNFPDSRYLPPAYMAKAEALRFQDKRPAAQEALKEFRALADSKGLTGRWKLEAELSEALSDPSLTGVKKRDRMIEIAARAGNEYPTVRNRARVAEGESYLEGETKEFAKARAIFEKIAADPKADDATLAGVYTGLGDCLFHDAVEKLRSKQEGSKQDAEQLLKDAVKRYMRVVVLHKDQTRYVSKAMFFAGRAFDVMEGGDARANAQKMYRAVISNYPKTDWAAEARNFKR
jgi:tetratricopeptide (TPR) repeat protein